MCLLGLSSVFFASEGRQHIMVIPNKVLLSCRAETATVYKEIMEDWLRRSDSSIYQRVLLKGLFSEYGQVILRVPFTDDGQKTFVVFCAYKQDEGKSLHCYFQQLKELFYTEEEFSEQMRSLLLEYGASCQVLGLSSATHKVLHEYGCITDQTHIVLQPRVVVWRNDDPTICYDDDYADMVRNGCRFFPVKDKTFESCKEPALVQLEWYDESCDPELEAIHEDANSSHFVRRNIAGSHNSLRCSVAALQRRRDTGSVDPYVTPNQLSPESDDDVAGLENSRRSRGMSEVALSASHEPHELASFESRYGKGVGVVCVGNGSSTTFSSKRTPLSREGACSASKKDELGELYDIL